jgi:hypothetical protein
MRLGYPGRDESRPYTNTVATRVRAGQGADPFGRQPYGRKGLRPEPLPENTDHYIRAKARYVSSQGQ